MALAVAPGLRSADWHAAIPSHVADLTPSRYRYRFLSRSCGNETHYHRQVAWIFLAPRLNDRTNFLG